MTRTAVLNLAAGLGLVLVLAAGLFSLPRPAGAQGPVGPAFTYQGRLRRDDVYLNNAICDFQFRLFSAASGGSQVGATQTVTGVPVRDGYFRATLNEANQFGPAAFTGDRRYLALAVRCSGEAAFTTLPQRIEVAPVPYAQYVLTATNSGGVPWTSIGDKPAGFADDVDDQNPYTPGFGLALSGTRFSLVTETVLSALGQSVQRRLAGGCSGESSIQLVNADGSVVCATTATTYTAGAGLSLANGVFSVNPGYTQRRVSGDCGDLDSHKAINRIDQVGTVGCATVPLGDITAVTAQEGLSGGGSGPGSVTVSVASPGGITDAMLADGAVTTSKLVTAAVTTDRLANGAVTSAKIADRTITFADLGFTCPERQLLKWTVSSWACQDDVAINFSPGPGISLTDNITVSARTGEGVAISTDGTQSLIANFPAPGGDAGLEDKPARSDHQHDLRYVKPTTSVPLGSQVSGSYQNGWQVTQLQGQPVANAGPSDGQALRFVSGQWQPASYNFPLAPVVNRYNSTSLSDKDGIITVSCQNAGERVIAGGCTCKGDVAIQDSFPSGPDGWYCDCHADTETNENQAWILCLKTTYP